MISRVVDEDVDERVLLWGRPRANDAQKRTLEMLSCAGAPIRNVLGREDKCSEQRQTKNRTRENKKRTDLGKAAAFKRNVTYKKPTRTRLIMTTLASFGKLSRKLSGVHARDFSSLNGFESQIGPSTCHAQARKLAYSVLLGTAKRFAPAEDKTSTIYFRFLELILTQVKKPS